MAWAQTMVMLASMADPSATAVLEAPEVNGTVERVEGLTIVHVWGTPEEMGFAHGYLVGRFFVEGLKEVFELLPPSAVRMVDLLRSRTPLIDMGRDYNNEVDGLYAGMLASQGEEGLMMPTLGRPIDKTDLLVWNGYDMFRAVGCSGLTCWADRTEGDGAITGRTLDLGVLSPTWVESQIVLVRHPDNGHTTIAVTPVGLVGIMTGINTHGVCGFLHDGNGPTMDAVLEQERPAMAAIRAVLESADDHNAFDTASRELTAQGPFPFSYMVRVVRPGEDPARVFTLDATGMGVNARDASFCVTTNHYVDQSALDPGPRPNNSVRRFRTLRSACVDDDGRVDAEDVWHALGQVAPGGQRFTTLHAVVVQPDAGLLDIGIARRVDGRLRPATDFEPVRCSIAALCRPRALASDAESHTPPPGR